MVTLTVAEMVGIAGFVLAVSLAIARVLDRVRLGTSVMQSFDYYGDSEQHDENYEMLVTNMGTRATTITRLEVYPYVRRWWFFKRLGASSMFVTDEMGLGFIRLPSGETKKFDFPFHQLNMRVGEAPPEGPDGIKPKRPKADGHICRIHHTAGRWPKDVVLR